MGKRFSFWLDNEEQEKELKTKAKKEGRSVSNFIKHKCQIFKEGKQ